MATAEIRIEYTALSTLLRAPRNAKKHDVAALRQSMERWGFTQPLAINEATGRLVEGHGRLDVLQSLKAEGVKAPARVTVKKSEWYVPVVRGLSFASEQEAEAYLVAANQLTIAGGWDERLLGETIASLKASNAGFAGLGFDQGKLDALAASFAPAVAEVVAALPSTPAPEPIAPVAAPAPVAPVAPAAPVVLAESPIESSDGQYVPPPTVAEEGTDHLQAEGVLDPTNHIPNEHPRRMVRLLTWGKYNIPVTPEEGAKFEATIAAWLEANGSLYGFLNSILG
jgi:hypothetical protein